MPSENLWTTQLETKAPVYAHPRDTVCTAAEVENRVRIVCSVALRQEQTPCGTEGRIGNVSVSNIQLEGQMHPQIDNSVVIFNVFWNDINSFIFSA